MFHFLSYLLLSLSFINFIHGCLYTATQCQCQVSSTPGKCLRLLSGTTTRCIIDNCLSGNYVCSCAGDSLCSLDSCGAWLPTALTGNEVVGEEVDCSLDPAGSASNRKCTHYLGPYSSTPPPPSPSPTPSISSTPNALYEVRIGGAVSGAEQFDMPRYTTQADLDFLNTPQDPNVPVLWSFPNTLKKRFAHFRLYRDNANSQTILCVIYNKYTLPHDESSAVAAAATATGMNGQPLTTLICDDLIVGIGIECNNASPSVIMFNHYTMISYNDGFCFTNLDDGPVRIEFSQMNLFDGITFQSPGGAVREYLFSSGSLPSGMSVGGIDSNGYSLNGALQIYIDVVNKYPVA